MNKSNEDNQFWKIIDRFGLVIGIIATLSTITPIIWAFIVFAQKGLTATVPAWTIFVASLFAMILGISLGRRSNPKNIAKKIKRDEAFDAIWEINQMNDEVDGPFCKTCSTRMEPSQKVNTVDRSKYFAFACKNPSCERRGAVTSGLAAQNIEDAKRRASEYFIGQKRKNDMAKRK
ncbi:MAG: hypothetical protein HYZ22_13120 [Chloroflexi bacterium]|nr:hypothetical protein [Chloroflexota bacterium]